MRDEGAGAKRRPLLAGNWKMHGMRAHLCEVEAIDEAARDLEVVLCLPATLIPVAAARVRHVAVGAQDCHVADKGPYTGQLSAAMLADGGARWVLIGHSECRAAGQAPREVAAKLAASAAHLRPILCVGEVERHHGCGTIVEQLLASLPAEAEAARLTVAYEPVWAIGTGVTPTPEEIDAVHARLRTTLADRFGESGANVRLLYGGSVTSDNAGGILRQEHVDGLLVGGASLFASRFLPIIEQFAAMDPRGAR
jgi:triosephosphate isomerase